MAPEPEKPGLSDEQVVALAEAFEICDNDDAKRRDAVEAKLREFAGEPKTTTLDLVKIFRNAASRVPIGLLSASWVAMTARLHVLVVAAVVVLFIAPMRRQRSL